MKRITGLVTIVSLVLLLFPIHVFAVEFSINETKIDAYLQENGDVKVIETHTYQFDGEFNGITRTLIPKDETSISDFKATENGTSLKVELDDETYNIYRGGEDETVTIQLSYVIKDGIDIYTDMGEFYWAFFDSNNESDYENLTITIHPPQSTNDVIAYGFDAAYGKETIQDDGIVVYQMGFVENGKNGNIRVAYDNVIFPATNVSNNISLRDTLIQEQQELAVKHAKFLERQEALNNAAPYIIGVYALFLMLLLFNGWRRKQATLHEAIRLYHSQSIVPKERMSMPATVYYFRSFVVGYGELLTIGMMDLVRKGIIIPQENETYSLANQKTDFEHENHLIDLLFYKIGENNIFTFEQLKKNSENQEMMKSLHDNFVKYQTSLRKEIDSHHLFDKQLKLRWFTGSVSLLLIPFMIVLGIHDLFMWLFFSLILMGGLLLFAFLFKPRTVKGQLIKHEWQQFKENFMDIQSNSWYSLSKDDKERALLFSTGLNDKKLKEKNNSFIKQGQFSQDDSVYQLLLLLTLSTTAYSSFGSAATVSAQTSTSTSSGTGVGGGGGGSGAF